MALLAAALLSSLSLAHGHEIAQVHAPVALRARPGGAVLARVGALTELGSPQTLSVVARSGRWLKVTSERLPTGAQAWVDGGSPRLSLTRTSLSIVVRLDAKRLELRSGDRVLRSFTVGVGSPSFPTPLGRFAVTDKAAGDAYGPDYGCCVLALTAHQRHLPARWRGGDRVAIHGTDAPWTIGRAASTGCLHATAIDLRYLMRLVPLGTPVTISR
jgi:L,D-transpeptidase catalytic domain